MRSVERVANSAGRRKGITILRTLLTMVMAGICLAVAGCAADDEGGGGNAFIVQGNVASFAGAGNEAGVVVFVKDTNHRTATSGDGTFILDGVPLGNYSLVFEKGGVQAEYGLIALCPVVITLSDIEVRADLSVSIGGVDATPAFTPFQAGSDSPLTGTWSGTAGGRSQGSSQVTFVFGQNGSVNVRPTDGTGAGTYGVSGSQVYGSFSTGDGVISFSTTISGTSMSGRWVKYNVSGDDGPLDLTKR